MFPFSSLISHYLNRNPEGADDAIRRPSGNANDEREHTDYKRDDKVCLFHIVGASLHSPCPVMIHPCSAGLWRQILAPEGRAVVSPLGTEGK